MHKLDREKTPFANFNILDPQCRYTPERLFFGICSNIGEKKTSKKMN